MILPSPLHGAAGHSHKAADLLIWQVQNKMQDQNTLLLNRQTGEGISHKLVFDMQVIPVGRECKSVTGVMIYNAELVHLHLRKVAE